MLPRWGSPRMRSAVGELGALRDLLFLLRLPPRSYWYSGNLALNAFMRRSYSSFQGAFFSTPIELHSLPRSLDSSPVEKVGFALAN